MKKNRERLGQIADGLVNLEKEPATWERNSQKAVLLRAARDIWEDQTVFHSWLKNAVRLDPKRCETIMLVDTESPRLIALNMNPDQAIAVHMASA